MENQEAPGWQGTASLEEGCDLDSGEGLGRRAHRGQSIHLPVAVERVVIQIALADLWRAIIHSGEEGVDRHVRRAIDPVGGVEEPGGYRSRRGDALAHD